MYRRLFHTSTLWASAGFLLVVLVSWSRYWITGSPAVDHNPIPGYSYPLLVLLLLGLVSICAFRGTLAYWGQWFLLLAACCMPPFLSNDLFSFWAYGEAFNQGQWVYGNEIFLNSTDMYKYVGDLYKDTPCIYGPLALWISSGITSVAAGDFLTLFLLTKIVFLGIFVISWKWSRYISNVYKLPRFWVTAIYFNPLVLIEGLGQNHTDIIGMLMIVPGLLYWLNGKGAWLALGIGLALSVKMTFIFLLPLLLFHNNYKAGFYKWERMPVIFLYGMLCLSGFFLPHLSFFPRTESLTAPFSILGQLRPSGTWPDLIGELIGMASGDEVRGVAWKILKLVFALFSFGIVGFVTWRWYKSKMKISIVHVVLIFGTVLLTFYSHRFFPWYLLSLVPLVILVSQKNWLEWIIWLGFWSVLQQGMHMEESGTPFSVAVVAFTTLICCLLFLWKFKKRLLPEG